MNAGIGCSLRGQGGARTVPLPPHLEVACRNLSEVIVLQAQALGGFLGMRWEYSAEVDVDRIDLGDEYLGCMGGGPPFRVALRATPSTLLGADAALALDFWTAVLPMRLDGAGVDGRCEAAVAQLDVLRAMGYPAESLEHRLLHADRFGRIWLDACGAHPPADDRAFALAVLEVGMSDAIECEKRQQERGRGAAVCRIAPRFRGWMGPTSGAGGDAA